MCVYIYIRVINKARDQVYRFDPFITRQTLEKNSLFYFYHICRITNFLNLME